MYISIALTCIHQQAYDQLIYELLNIHFHHKTIFAHPLKYYYQMYKDIYRLMFYKKLFLNIVQLLFKGNI